MPAAPRKACASECDRTEGVFGLVDCLVCEIAANRDSAAAAATRLAETHQAIQERGQRRLEGFRRQVIVDRLQAEGIPVTQANIDWVARKIADTPPSTRIR